MGTYFFAHGPRSFATNMYIADIPAISIMKITGHKTEKSFLRYIKISPEDNAKKMLQHPLFKQSNLENCKLNFTFFNIFYFFLFLI